MHLCTISLGTYRASMIVMTHGIATDSIYWVLRSAFLGEELEDAKCKLSLGKTVRFVRSRVSVSPMADKSSLSEVLPMSQGRGEGSRGYQRRRHPAFPGR